MQPYRQNKSFSAPNFGSAINSRAFASGGYRFGFNGMEKDSENNSGAYDFGARVYDGRLGRFLSLDFFISEFAMITGYLFSANNPLFYIDKNGHFALSYEMISNYPKLSNYINNQLKKDVINSPILKAQLMKKGQFLSDAQLLESLTKDQGPSVGFKNDLIFCAGGLTATDALQKPLHITLHGELLKQAENIITNDAYSEEEKQAAILSVTSTLLHENVHYYDLLFDGKHQPDRTIPGTSKTAEIGEQFEIVVWGTDIGSSKYDLPSEDQDKPELVFPEYQKDALKIVKKLNESGDTQKVLPTLIYE